MRKIALLAATAALMAAPALAQQAPQYAPSPAMPGYPPAPAVQAPRYAPPPQAPGYAPAPAQAVPPTVKPHRERVRAAPHRRAPTDYESQRTGLPSRARARTGGPLDAGPNTPQANAAFMGGGVILEGPPGAPAPAPHAITTPPGPDGVVRNYMRIDTR